MSDFGRFYDKICDTPEDINRASTPDGIRQLFYRNMRRAHPVVAAVFNMAEARGLKGEDVYTVMAFELLKRLERLEDLQLEISTLSPIPPFIIPEKQP